jgi:hypothetical protein
MHLYCRLSWTDKKSCIFSVDCLCQSSPKKQILIIFFPSLDLDPRGSDPSPPSLTFINVVACTSRSGRHLSYLRKEDSTHSRRGWRTLPTIVEAQVTRRRGPPSRPRLPRPRAAMSTSTAHPRHRCQGRGRLHAARH